MASRIQGITVEIGGDTMKLSKALEGVNKTIKGTQSSLKDVNKTMRGSVLLQSEYYGAAEPPVRCGESHLSGLTEPPHFVY